jgi:3-hydroxyisobutyrate dehydrogenase-like beta-hydroxyacid dehydrogenase
MKIAVLGLGLMGTAIAERLQAAGHDLCLYNRTREKALAVAQGGGCEVAENKAELLAIADVCFTVVSDDDALEQAVLGSDGVLANARSGTLLIDMSTVSVSCSARVAAAAGERGVAYLRAPVSGNPGVVRAGNLTIIVSGPRTRYDQSTPLLTDIGPHLYYVGDTEQSRVVKLALNLMLAGTAALLADALELADNGGVDVGTMLEVTAGSAVGSPFVRYKTEPLLRGDYSATFTTDMMRKDLRLISEQASSSGASLGLAAGLTRLYEESSEAGYGDADLMALRLARSDR